MRKLNVISLKLIFVSCILLSQLLLALTLLLLEISNDNHKHKTLSLHQSPYHIFSLSLGCKLRSTISSLLGGNLVSKLLLFRKQTKLSKTHRHEDCLIARIYEKKSWNIEIWGFHSTATIFNPGKVCFITFPLLCVFKYIS